MRRSQSGAAATQHGTGQRTKCYCRDLPIAPTANTAIRGALAMRLFAGLTLVETEIA